MKTNPTFCLALMPLLLLFSCQHRSTIEVRKLTHSTEIYHTCVKKLTAVIVHDIFGPTVASRIYAYPAIAAYEVIRNEHPGSFTFTGKLTGLSSLPKPVKGLDYDFAIASNLAYLGTARKLVFTGIKLQNYRDSLILYYRSAGVPEDVLQNSIAYADTMTSALRAWIKKDMYAKTRSYPKYTLSHDPGKWQPTPPAYQDGNEPNWRFIRPMLLDSAGEFKPPVPGSFSKEKGSSFYNEALKVYTTGLRLTAEQNAIANFWDCNPFALILNGHAMFASKKISPGAHWQLICLSASGKAHSSMERTCFAQALVSVGIFDSFICCWDEKYRSQQIRPETYINLYIDPAWKPLLQTPPFPEYISGHSMISGTASLLLTRIYGDNFAFTDSSELAYGLPLRRFGSFEQAAAEASVSRLYGGIHFMPAISQGRICAEHIGNFLVKKLGLQGIALP